jgi:hypothetical protein
MAVLITTEVLGEISVLTSVENQSELTTAWIRSGDGLIGFGEYKFLEMIDLSRHELGGITNYLILRSKTMFTVAALGQCFLLHFHLIQMKNQY